MAEGVLNKIILWGLLILFIFIFLFALYNPREGFMGKIAKLALSAERFLPTEPSKELKADESLPQAVIKVQKTFIEQISMFPQTEKCLLKFSSLSDL